MVQRQYIGGGAHRVEAASLIVTGPGSDAELRRLATTLATAAGNGLSPPA